jgi:amidohydrolase
MLDLIKLRKKLHTLAEISGKEIKTKSLLKEILEKFKPDRLEEMCGSLIAVFDSAKKGRNIAFRADMDALPVGESNVFSHRSKDPRTAHLCGHDGHSTTLIGLAEHISQNRPRKGRAVLIFQSAEETGEGAKALIADPEFKKLKIDEFYGFHNIPGCESGTVLYREGVFASASVGMIIEFEGKNSHASQPENGISPVTALTELIKFVQDVTAGKISRFSSKVLISIVGVKAGGRDFGVNPGDGELDLTLRAFENRDIKKIKELIVSKAGETAKKHGLQFNIRYLEEFPSVENDSGLVAKLKKICAKNSFKTKKISLPFFWSEDFAYYNKIGSAVFFGIGSGTDQLPLHNKSYDYPDEILSFSVSLFSHLYDLSDDL